MLRYKWTRLRIVKKRPRMDNLYAMRKTYWLDGDVKVEVNIAMEIRAYRALWTSTTEVDDTAWRVEVIVREA